MDSSHLLTLIQQSFNTRYSISARGVLDSLPDCFTITDPYISGHPIVFASNGFLKMSGYSRDEIIGKNGRFFQGPKTNKRAVSEIRQAIIEERSCQISLLNYKKDGTPFWMLFSMTPVFYQNDGRVVHFLAVQVPIFKKRRNGSGCCGGHDNGSGLMREIYFGSCRREICTELGRVLTLDSDSKGLGIEEEACEASEAEKRKAVNGINSVLSILMEYSGEMVCAKRSSSLEAKAISSSLSIALGRIKQSFVLTDPHLPDMPIVYASDAFLKLTGYARHEVLGRNCRFLGGVDTDNSVIEQMRLSIQAEQPCTVRILNYRKNNTAFWNHLHISPVRNATGKVAYFVGVQMDEGLREESGGLSREMKLRSCVGAVRVAVRSSSISASSSKS